MPDANLPRVTKRRNLPAGTVPFEVGVAAAREPDVLASLIANTPFPDRDIRLGSIRLEAAGGGDISLGGWNGPVLFRGSASTFSSLGVYSSAAGALADLWPGAGSAPGSELTAQPDHRWAVLRWGYDLAGSFKGSLGLGAGARVTFGADGRKEGVFGVIRRINKDTGARDVLNDLVQAWMLPHQLSGAAALDPGTWILAEIDGTIKATLGAGYGYDFHWVRATRLGGLAGDIGLRIEAAVEAALGFTAAGRFVLLLSRENEEPVVRLRLYRLALNGWRFAFDLKAAAQADIPAPASADDFLKAVFGVHAAQIVQDLKALEAWTQPEASPGAALAALSFGYLAGLVEKLTGIDPRSEFERARGRLLDFIARWDALPQRISALLWKLLEGQVDLAPVRELARRLADGSDAELRSQIGRLLRRADFFRTTEGRLLEELAGRSLLAALHDTAALAEIRRGAMAAAELLDDGAIEEVLRRLQRLLEERLNLDRVGELAGSDFARLDEWLQAKLAAFLDEKLTPARFEELRAALGELMQKRQEFYQAAREAATRKFEAALAWRWERAEERSALIDISFDFAAADPGDALRRAVGGEFNELLLAATPGVRLNGAELTHGIRRRSAVDIALPYFEKKTAAAAQSIAALRVTEDGAGRLLIYRLDSTDAVRDEVRGRMSRDSSLTVAGLWQAVSGNEVRFHARPSLTVSYSLRQANNDMKTAELERLLEPLVAEYFPGEFGAVEDGGVARSLSTFLRNLDDYIEQIAHNGVNTFGDTLISLEVSAPAALLAAWLEAPASRRDPAYLAMSLAIQAALKRLLPYCFFADRRNRLAGLEAVAPLLVWASIPPATKGKSDVFWNWPDRDEQQRRVFDPRTQANLLRRLEELHRLLAERPEPAYVKRAADYRPEAQVAAELTATALKGRRVLFEGLLFVEAEIIEAARAAGLKMAEFRRTKTAKPAEAVRALAEFGEKIVDAFHRKLRSVYGGAVLRALGPVVLLEAARALSADPGLRSARPNALLYLAVLREGASFNLQEFIDGHSLPAEDLIVEQKLVRFEQGLL